MKLFVVLLFFSSLGQAQLTCKLSNKVNIISAEIIENFDKSIVVRNPYVMVDGVYTIASAFSGYTGVGICAILKKSFVSAIVQKLPNPIEAVLLKENGDIYDTHMTVEVYQHIRCK